MASKRSHSAASSGRTSFIPRTACSAAGLAGGFAAGGAAAADGCGRTVSVIADQAVALSGIVRRSGSSAGARGSPP